MRKSPNVKPLKIGIDARLAYRRGVGTYAANLILALSRIDRHNHYTIFNAPRALVKRVSNDRFRWVDLDFPNAAYYEQVQLPRAADKNDLDLLHYVDNSGTAIGDIPFVLTLHDTMHTRPLSEVRSNPTFRQRLIHLYKQWAISRSAPRAAAILTVSEFSRDSILSVMKIPRSRITVTMEGVDRSIFRPSAKKHSKLFKILVHGATDERKNLLNILKAARILKDAGEVFQLVVIGLDESEMENTDYLREESDLGLGRQVEWAGKVEPEMLPDVYAEADLLLYPSRLEGFGLPVLEAFACGVPVVTSKTSSLPEVAGKAALLVDPEKPQAIAQAVRKLMDHPALARRLAAEGSRRAKRFNWENTARSTLKVYEQVGADLG